MRSLNDLDRSQRSLLRDEYTGIKDPCGDQLDEFWNKKELEQRLIVLTKVVQVARRILYSSSSSRSTSLSRSSNRSKFH